MPRRTIGSEDGDHSKKRHLGGGCVWLWWWGWGGGGGFCVGGVVQVHGGRYWDLTAVGMVAKGSRQSYKGRMRDPKAFLCSKSTESLGFRENIRKESKGGKKKKGEALKKPSVGEGVPLHARSYR